MSEPLPLPLAPLALPFSAHRSFVRPISDSDEHHDDRLQAESVGRDLRSILPGGVQSSSNLQTWESDGWCLTSTELN